MDSSNNQSGEVTFQPGDFLVREKTVCDALYIIKEGQLEVFRTGASGERVPIGLISSGQYVGETAMLLNRQHSSNVVALTPVKAVKLTRAAIEAQLEKVPGWLIALTKGLIDRLQAANEILRRNGLVDEVLQGRLRAVEEKFKKAE